MTRGRVVGTKEALARTGLEPARRLAWLFSIVLCLAACAPQRLALRNSSQLTEPRDLGCPEDRDVLVLCGAGVCTIVPEGPGPASAGTLTRGAVVSPLPTAGAPQRWWGPEQSPSRGQATITFEVHQDQPLAKLPASVQTLVAEEAKKPHERHHIFPQEFKEWFEVQGINIHDWVLTILLEDHRRIHRGESGGPWNADWRAWIKPRQFGATRESIYLFAGEMIYRYQLLGPLTRYYTPKANLIQEEDP